MFKQYRKIEKGEFIVVGVDTAAGGNDFTAAQFLSKTKVDVPLVYHSRIITTEFTNQLVPVLERIFDETGVKPVVAYERNNGGAFEMDRLAAMNRLNKYEIFKMPSFGRENPPDAIQYGWTTSTATRPKMLQDLKNAVDNRVLTIYDRETINEMFSFIISQTSSSWKAQAEKNAKDDLVMSLGIAYQLYQLCEAPKESVVNVDEIVERNKFLAQKWQM
ncbi:MAG: hypothetical protein KatS3mg101_0944 [Patescibacteria group bacterium]|nr:MAG: hypothetical protein KatS3mg101_0944 [Patescibacteria group bacterium]